MWGIRTRYGEPSGCCGAGTRSWTLEDEKYQSQILLVTVVKRGRQEHTGHLDECCRWLTWMVGRRRRATESGPNGGSARAWFVWDLAYRRGARTFNYGMTSFLRCMQPIFSDHCHIIVQ